MFNNISLELEKKALKDALQNIDTEDEKEMEVYKIFERCSKEETSSKEMLEELKKIKDLKDYNDNFRDFVDSRIKNLELLEKESKEIKDLKEEIVKENENLEENLKDRNVEYEEDIEKQNNELNNISEISNNQKNIDISTTFLEQKKTKEELEDDLNLLKEKNQVLENEKKSGEEFDEKITDETKSLYMNNSTHDEQMNQIQEDAYKNKKIYTGTNLQDVINNYDYYLQNQTDDSMLNVKINYEDNRVEVNFSYKGTEVNENVPSTSFIYTGDDEIQYYYNEIYPYLIEEHVIDGETSTLENGNHLESVNSNSETLEVTGNTEEVLDAKDDIEDANTRKKGISRQREFYMPNNNGVNNKGIIIIFLFTIIVICLVIIITSFM